MSNWPLLVSAICITLYWVTVAIKAISLARKIGKDPNVLPRENTGLFIRLIWAPAIAMWIFLLWGGYFSGDETIRITSVIAAAIVLIATALTFCCWHQMGKSWRIGIDPKEKTELIITGPYQYVLHPIYSLSMILGLATLATLPTFAMLIVVSIHIIMLNLEGRREEKYLLRAHGQTYAEYRQKVGRFFPKMIRCPFSKTC